MLVYAPEIELLGGGMDGEVVATLPEPLILRLTLLSVFSAKIFRIFRSLSVILAHSACAAPLYCTEPHPMQIVRAEVAAGGELGVK